LNVTISAKGRFFRRERKMSNPAVGDIFSVGGNPYMGVNDIYGISQSDANAPGVSWAPTGADNALAVNTAAQSMNFGVPPLSQTVTELGIDFIQYTYLAPPWEDDTNKYIMPEMLAFSVNELDTEANSTTILTLPKINQIMYEAWSDVKAVAVEGDPNSVEDAIKFIKYLNKYGEEAIEMYHRARKNPRLMKMLEKDSEGNPKNVPNPLQEIRELYHLSLQDVFCWCTRFGIMNKVTFLGVVINTNRAVSLETEEHYNNHQHYCDVNVGFAKRLFVANVFGPNDQVTTGSKLFLNLKRKKTQTSGKVSFEEYYVMPLGTKEDYCRQIDRSYTDPSGRHMNGHSWMVGTVMVPGIRTPNMTSVANAANIGIRCNERAAYESHGSLPTLTVAVGFKH
jgi:hypothetical protein